MNRSFFVCYEYIGFVLVWIGYLLLDEVAVFIRYLFKGVADTKGISEIMTRHAVRAVGGNALCFCKPLSVDLFIDEPKNYAAFGITRRESLFKALLESDLTEEIFIGVRSRNFQYLIFSSIMILFKFHDIFCNFDFI